MVFDPINRERGVFLVAPPDFSYLFVLADRGDYVLPWTQYLVQYENRHVRYRKEFDAYWANQGA